MKKHTLEVTVGLFMIAGQALAGQSGMVMALLMALGMNFFAYCSPKS